MADIVLYGAGKNAEKAFSLLMGIQGVNIRGITDSNPKAIKNNYIFTDIPVISGDELKKYDDCLILITPDIEVAGEIASFLRNKDILK